MTTLRRLFRARRRPIPAPSAERIRAARIAEIRTLLAEIAEQPCSCRD